MAKVTPLLAAGSYTAITAPPSRKSTAGLFCSRIVSKRARITAKLGMNPPSSPVLFLQFVGAL
jgi:hypothetical protein